MAGASLTISSRNYSSWCLRGWLLCRLAGLDVEIVSLPPDDEQARDELLLLSPSFQVPRLVHDGVEVWDILAIGEYLAEIRPKAGLLPKDRAARAHCRSICGEMHSGFQNLRSALPMNLKAHHPGSTVWSGAQADIDRIVEIWEDCFGRYGGPWLFGKPGMADAIFAPVCTRFRTYDVKLDRDCAAYRDRVLDWEPMVEWTRAALAEPEALEELEVEF
jgi:glutathione S-transferase